MSFYELVKSVIDETVKVSIPGFAPELALCATIVLMLLARMPRWGHRIHSFWIALPGTLVALYLTAPWNLLNENATPSATSIFDGMLVYDPLTVYFRGILIFFAVLFLFFTRLSGIPDREDSPDFYSLVLGATIGMCVMVSANHLLTVFLGVEMASVPSYALAGILKGRRKSSEAALKYSVYGAGASGVMLYGISLIAGSLGSLHLPTLATQLATLPADVLAERQSVLMLAGVMVAVGLSFKLSAVPFHFWCPDVFEGACAEVAAFLSVASKAAALALLVRVSLGFAYAPAPKAEVIEPPPQAAVADDMSGALAAATFAQPEAAGEVATDAALPLAEAADPAADVDPSDVDVRGEPDDSDLALNTNSAVARGEALRPVRRYIVGLLSILAAITCTFGNLAAYAQTNIKRLLAYSTIAHAGYMIMPVAAAVQLSGSSNPAMAQAAVAALAFYVGVYLFMNLGAFAIVAFLRNVMGSEEIADYAGLIRRCPGIVILLSVILFSLVGMPPLSGFIGKWLAFSALASAQLWLLLVIGGVNTVLSLFYYLRVVKVMALDPEPQDRLPVEFPLVSSEGVQLLVIIAPVIVLGIWWDPLYRMSLAAASTLLT